MPTTTADSLNPRTTHYEFLGPLGAIAISLGVPAVSYLLYFGCSEQAGGCPPQLHSVSDRVITAITDPSWWKNLWDTDATLIYLGWYAFCVLAWAILPGDQVQGTVMRNGARKTYKINGTTSSSCLYTLSLNIFSLFHLLARPRHRFWRHSSLRSPILHVHLREMGRYSHSRALDVLCPSRLRLRGLVPNWQATCPRRQLWKRYLRRKPSSPKSRVRVSHGTAQWFIGRELNPSIGSFDIKTFNELRPGLILWVLINISMACEQATRRGGLANVTDSMWLVILFQAWYVADGLYNEVRLQMSIPSTLSHSSQPALFTTMDITSDGFGFMLSVGDLVVVPFTYTVQARYLAFHPIELGPAWVAGILAVNFLGYWIFRSSNGEKNDFRNGKNPKGLRDISHLSSPTC